MTGAIIVSVSWEKRCIKAPKNLRFLKVGVFLGRGGGGKSAKRGYFLIWRTLMGYKLCTGVGVSGSDRSGFSFLD